MPGQTIVVIEDEERIAGAVVARLRAEGFLVEVAGTGPAGVELCRRVAPDLVVLGPDADTTDPAAVEAEIIAWCKSKLAGYKCPTSVEVRDELSRTATGKLQKFRLRAPYWEGRDRQVN